MQAAQLLIETGKSATTSRAWPRSPRGAFLIPPALLLVADLAGTVHSRMVSEIGRILLAEGLSDTKFAARRYGAPLSKAHRLQKV